MVDIKNALTANGNLKTDVHKNIRDQFAAVLVQNMSLETTPNGDYAYIIATADDKPVYARVSFVITLADPMVAKPKPTKKAKEKEVVEVPELF